MAKNELTFEVIEESAMTFVARGRKSSVSPELVENLKRLGKGKALAITSMKVNPKAENAKTERAKYGAQIRQAGKQAGREVTIRWSLAGVPQVSVK